MTGATGCIGRAVVNEAVKHGWHVRGLARNKPLNWPPEADFELGDALDPQCVVRVASGCDSIVHLAGPAHDHRAQTDSLMRTFVKSAQVVAQTARASGARLVLVSSSAVYGSHADVVDESTLPLPDSPYGVAKLESERAATKIYPNILILRPAVVFGQYDKGNVARLIRSVARFGPTVVGRGDNRKSVLFAPHLAQRVLALIDSHVRLGTWCVADRDPPTQQRLISTIAAILGRRQRVIHLPIGLFRAVARATNLLTQSGRWSAGIEQLTRSTVVDGVRLDNLIGFQESVALDDALAVAVHWIIKDGEFSASSSRKEGSF